MELRKSGSSSPDSDKKRKDSPTGHAKTSHGKHSHSQESKPAAPSHSHESKPATPARHASGATRPRSSSPTVAHTPPPMDSVRLDVEPVPHRMSSQSSAGASAPPHRMSSQSSAGASTPAHRMSSQSSAGTSAPPHRMSSQSSAGAIALQVKRSSTDSAKQEKLEKDVKISEVVKIPLPAVIVCRIFGVTSSESVGELIYKYFVMKLPLFLNDHWADSEVQEVVSKIRESIEESKIKEFPLIPAATADSKDKVIEALVVFVDVMSDPKLESQKKKTVNPSFIRLRSVIVTAGMRVKDIENSHLYDDVPPAFKVWMEAGVRIATISSTTKDAQKDYMTYTNHGDMSAYITDTISTMNPLIQTGDPKSPDFRNMCKKVLQVETTSVLLLTSKISEAKAGQKCGMEVILLAREEMIGKTPLSEIKRDSIKDINVVKSLKSVVLIK